MAVLSLTRGGDAGKEWRIATMIWITDVVKLDSKIVYVSALRVDEMFFCGYEGIVVVVVVEEEEQERRYMYCAV